MRIEYINPFVEASIDILQEVLEDAEITKEDLYLKETTQPILGVAVLVGLAGGVRGRVLFDMTEETAMALSGAMNGEDCNAFDELARSTICELANLISGRAITKLHGLGFTFHISPPTIFTGDNMEITSPSIEAFIVPLATPFGKLEINVAIKEKQD
jgi:chemotaxis protein CheX